MRPIARSLLGPVTIHISEPDKVLSLKQSQAMNLSINSVIPRPGGLLYPNMTMRLKAIKDYLFIIKYWLLYVSVLFCFYRKYKL
jgi:hypothetical protein